MKKNLKSYASWRRDYSKSYESWSESYWAVDFIFTFYLFHVLSGVTKRKKLEMSFYCIYKLHMDRLSLYFSTSWI